MRVQVVPRYHFNVYDGVAIPDEDGQEFEGREEARQEAVRYAGEIIKDQSRRYAVREEWRMEVTDERGLVLFRLDFSVLEASSLPEAYARS